VLIIPFFLGIDLAIPDRMLLRRFVWVVGEAILKQCRSNGRHFNPPSSRESCRRQRALVDFDAPSRNYGGFIFFVFLSTPF